MFYNTNKCVENNYLDLSLLSELYQIYFQQFFTVTEKEQCKCKCFISQWGRNTVSGKGSTHTDVFW